MFGPLDFELSRFRCILAMTEYPFDAAACTSGPLELKKDTVKNIFRTLKSFLQ